MTEPTAPRPVPGPPRPGPGPGTGAPRAASDAAPADGATGIQRSFADLEPRPVAEHVAVFEAEHARLQRELGTIDQL